MSSVTEIAAAASEAGIEGQNNLIAFTLGYGAALTESKAIAPGKGKIVYFDAIGGRAEPILLVLRLAKADFEDKRYTLAEFADPDSAYHKAKAAGEFTTFAASKAGLPVYTENGKRYFETNAIMRYLGARYGFYSTDPETMFQIDIVMEKVELVLKHCGIAPHSHYCLARINKAMGKGDGPTDEQTANCFAMYEEYINFGESQLAGHGKAFMAGTDTPTIADFRYVVQFANSIYNTGESCQLGAEMQDRVKAMIATKPTFKKWVEETMPAIIKDITTPNLMW